MRNPVFEKFFGFSDKSQRLIHLSDISLRFNYDFFSLKFFLSYADPLRHDLGAKTTAALNGNHASQRDFLTSDSCRNQPQVGLDTLIVLEPQMISLRIDIIDFLIGAFLFNHNRIGGR